MEPMRQQDEDVVQAAGPLPSAETLLRRLTGSLAHNLNNRLTGVIGSLELALQEARDTVLTGHLQQGLTCALQAAELVRRLVVFAFRPSDHANVTVLSLGHVAENTACRVREQHRPGLIVAVVSTSASLIHGNTVLLQTALDQLVDNAVEAMPQGGTLTLRVEEEGTNVCLSVVDTGGGLADEVAAQLFQPFVTTRCAGHLGLGLILCRDFVQAQGGTLRLDWEAGKGTTAILTFPASHGSPSSADPSVLPPQPGNSIVASGGCEPPGSVPDPGRVPGG